MAWPSGRRSFCRNFLPTGKDELASVAPTKGSGTLTSTPVVFRDPTPAPAIAPIVALSSDD